MADTSSADNRRRVYWTNTAMNSSTEDSDAYIPGLSKPGNRRQALKGRKTPEIKANVSLDRAAVDDILQPGQNLLVHDLTQSLDSHTKRRHTRSASFKDLRMEDKKRVANLIKELAKAGDEKEKVVSQLHQERVQYEQQILQLVAQQEEVLREREDIQLKLYETQQLLSQCKEEKAAPRQTQDDFILTTKPVATERPVPNAGQHHYEAEPFDDAKRPYTSLIDREIAMQLQQVQYSRPAPVSVGRGRHATRKHCDDEYELTLQNHFGKFPERGYDSRESGDSAQASNGARSRGKGKSSRNHLGPLREPIMSSTQKSSQLIEDMSFASLPTIASDNFQAIPADISPRTTLGFGDGFGNDVNANGKGRTRVGFLDEPEDLDSARVHSPVLEPGSEPTENRQFMEYYKKLTPAERKRELLHQRATLLEEQNRLRQILIDQEVQLKEKQKLLEEKKRQNMDPVADIDVRLHRVQEVYRDHGDHGDHGDRRRRREKGKTTEEAVQDMEVLAKRLDYSSLSSRSDSDASSYRGHRKKQMKSAGTSPMTLPTLASVGTSPLRLDRDLSDIPDLIDAGTSVSYRHFARSPPLSELPLTVNQQRASPFKRHTQSPGDKTLAVLNIVNSLERLESSLNGSFHSPYDNYVTNIVQASSRDEDLSEEKTEEEDFEESKILEEVFFLK